MPSSSQLFAGGLSSFGGGSIAQANPYVAAAGAVASALNPPSSSSLQAGPVSSTFNNSGWSVATGRARNDGTSTTTTDPVSGAVGSIAGAVKSPYVVIGAVVIGALAIYLIARRK